MVSDFDPQIEQKMKFPERKSELQNKMIANMIQKMIHLKSMKLISDPKALSQKTMSFYFNEKRPRGGKKIMIE